MYAIRSYYAAPCYRLAFGESDALPGLVIDRYGAVVVVQITTAGMEALREVILEALQQLLAPAGILLLNDTPVRALVITSYSIHYTKLYEHFPSPAPAGPAKSAV